MELQISRSRENSKRGELLVKNDFC
jgi:hypothetical protein